MTARARVKPCKQKECPFWKFCKYSHDQNKCRTSLSSNPDDVVAEID